MTDLTFQNLREANVNRCEQVFHPLNSWSPTDWATALAGECGEACNFVKKLRRLDDGGGNDIVKTKEEYIADIGEELADAVIYADLLAARLGINLESEIISKFNKVSDKMHSYYYL